MLCDQTSLWFPAEPIEHAAAGRRAARGAVDQAGDAARPGGESGAAHPPLPPGVRPRVTRRAQPDAHQPSGQPR